MTLVCLGAVDEEASSVTGRKDSLSINLEFVKVSLSRMRRTGSPAFIDTFIASKGGKMDTTLINISGEEFKIKYWGFLQDVSYLSIMHEC